MKRKYSKILGVAVTIGLLASLIAGAVPVSATVSEAAVTLPSTTAYINTLCKYTLVFQVNTDLPEGGTIVITFPEDTDITGLTDAVDADVTIAAKAGFGSLAFTATQAATTENADDRILTITVPDVNTDNMIAHGAEVEIVIGGVANAARIQNPSDPGDYTLTVSTSAETTKKESASYAIKSPVLGGGVYVYNASDLQVNFYGGAAALDDALDAGYFALEGFTITVGPGTYTLQADIDITGKGLTLNSSGDATDTEIDCAGAYGFIINNEDVTIDGFKIDDADVGITVDADDFTVTNCDIVDADAPGPGILIQDGGTDATVSNCTFDDCRIAIEFDACDPAVDLGDVDITDNVISGCDGDTDGIVFSGGNQDIDITGNTITANEGSGICFAAGGVACDSISIEGNTISANELHGIYVDTANAPTILQIRGNDIIDNDKDGILIDTWTKLTDVIMFNNITGNTDDAIETAEDVVAIFNWWGTTVTTEITAEFDGAGAVTYKPILNDTQEVVASGSKVATNATALDAQTACGVKVSAVEDAAAAKADVIAAAKYAANPEDDIAGAVAFFDVYIELSAAFAVDDDTKAKLKFYDDAITENSVAMYWTGDFWIECSDQLARTGIVYVDLTEDSIPAVDELEGTAFAIVGGVAVEAVSVLAAPVISAPVAGAIDVPVKPTFMWGVVTGAETYELQVADNYLFKGALAADPPIVDKIELPTNGFAVMTALDYSTSYYWRVRAVVPQVMGGLAGKTVIEEAIYSAWTVGVFSTEEAPAVPELVPFVCPQCGSHFDTEAALQAHVASAHAAAPLVPETPFYIWAIIAIGAVLVIAVLILIVRTRRAV